jgi:hypothetical protein
MLYGRINAVADVVMMIVADKAIAILILFFIIITFFSFMQ